MPPPARTTAPLLLLTQGHAGDRLGARLAPALRAAFPERELLGLGGPRMAAQGVRLVAESHRISAMGYSGLLPQLPRILQALLLTARHAHRRPPALVVAVDVWQPLRVLHRWAPGLRAVPHLCYLPPGPNFVGPARVHREVAGAFGAVVTPFAYQERLYRAAGAHTRLAAHAGLQTCREEATALPATAREPLLALLPGSRRLEVLAGLPVQLEAARLLRRHHPGLEPVICCAGEEVERLVRGRFPGPRTAPNARHVLARASLALVCSGTATLEAALLGCPGVVTYHGTALQRWEWHRFHVPRLARLRAAGIASPYVALPNIIAGEELYPEQLGAPPEAVAAAALSVLALPAAAVRARLDAVTATLCWEDAGAVVAAEARRLLGG